MTLSQDRWRKLTQEDRDDFKEWLLVGLEVATERGVKSYPVPVFQGDPLRHVTEELIDGLFYVFYALRERTEAHDSRPPYMSKLGDLLQKLVWTLQGGVMMKEQTIDLDGITFHVMGSRLDKGDRPFEFKITSKERT